MKKSVCLMAILGALGATSAIAASTQSVEIAFQGEVTEKTCDISLANGTKALDLGTIAAGAGNGTKGTVVPLTFKLSNCNGLTLDTNGGPVDLAEDLTNSNIVNSDVSVGKLATNKKNIVVQFYKDEGTTEGFLDTQTPENGTGDVFFVNAGFVAMKKISDEKTDPGVVNARAMFTVSYQ